VVRRCRGEGQTRADVILYQIRKIAQQLGLAYAGGKKIEDVLHPNTHAPDARATAALVWVEGDAIHDTEPNSHADGSKGSARFPSPLYGSLTACRRRSRSTPIPSTWPRSSASWGRRGGDVTSPRGAPLWWEAC